MAAEVAGMIEAVEWAEYIKFLWMEIIDGGMCPIKVYTDYKPLEIALKTEGSIKNHAEKIWLKSRKSWKVEPLHPVNG